VKTIATSRVSVIGVGMMGSFHARLLSTTVRSARVQVTVIKAKTSSKADPDVSDPMLVLFESESGCLSDVEIFIRTGVAYEVRTGPRFRSSAPRPRSGGWGYLTAERLPERPRARRRSRRRGGSPPGRSPRRACRRAVR
jgi:hypothetical protein